MGFQRNVMKHVLGLVKEIERETEDKRRAESLCVVGYAENCLNPSGGPSRLHSRHSSIASVSFNTLPTPTPYGSKKATSSRPNMSSEAKNQPSAGVQNSNSDFSNSNSRKQNPTEHILKTMLEGCLMLKDLVSCFEAYTKPMQNSNSATMVLESVMHRNLVIHEAMRELQNSQPILESTMLVSERNGKWKIRKVLFTGSSIQVQCTKRGRTVAVLDLTKKFSFTESANRSCIELNICDTPYALKLYSYVEHALWLEALSNKMAMGRIYKYVFSVPISQKLHLYNLFEGKSQPLYDRNRPPPLPFTTRIMDSSPSLLQSHISSEATLLSRAETAAGEPVSPSSPILSSGPRSEGVDMESKRIIRRLKPARVKITSGSTAESKVFRPKLSSHFPLEITDEMPSESNEGTDTENSKRVFGLSLRLRTKKRRDVEIFCGAQKRIWVHGKMNLTDRSETRWEISPKDIVHYYPHRSRHEFEIRIRQPYRDEEIIMSQNRKTSLSILRTVDSLENSLAALNPMNANHETVKIHFSSNESYDAFSRMFTWFISSPPPPFSNGPLLSHILLVSRYPSKTLYPFTESKAILNTLDSMADIAAEAGRTLGSTLGTASVHLERLRDSAIRLGPEGGESGPIRLLLQFLMKGYIDPSSIGLPSPEVDEEEDKFELKPENHIKSRITSRASSRNNSRNVSPARRQTSEGGSPASRTPKSSGSQDSYFAKDYKCTCGKGSCKLLVYRLLDRHRDLVFAKFDSPKPKQGVGVGDKNDSKGDPYSMSMRYWKLKLAWVLSEGLPRALRKCTTALPAPVSPHARVLGMTFGAYVKDMIRDEGDTKGIIHVIYELMVYGTHSSLMSASHEIGQFHPNVAHPKLLPVLLGAVALGSMEDQTNYLGKLLMLLQNALNRHLLCTSQYAWQNWMFPFLLQKKRVPKSTPQSPTSCKDNRDPMVQSIDLRGKRSASLGVSDFSTMGRIRKKSSKLHPNHHIQRQLKLVVSVFSKVHAHEIVGTDSDEIRYSRSVSPPSTPPRARRANTVDLSGRKHRKPSPVMSDPKKRSSSSAGRKTIIENILKKGGGDGRLKRSMRDLECYRTIALLQDFVPWTTEARCIGSMILTSTALMIKSLEPLISRHRNMGSPSGSRRSSALTLGKWGFGGNMKGKASLAYSEQVANNMLHFLTLVGTFVLMMPPKPRAVFDTLDTQSRSNDIGMLDVAMEAAMSLKLPQLAPSGSLKKDLTKILTIFANLRKELKSLPNPDAVKRVKEIKEEWSTVSQVGQPIISTPTSPDQAKGKKQRKSWFKLGRAKSYKKVHNNTPPKSPSKDHKEDTFKRSQSWLGAPGRLLHRLSHSDGEGKKGSPKSGQGTLRTIGTLHSDPGGPSLFGGHGVSRGYFKKSAGGLVSTVGLSISSVEYAQNFVRGRRNSHVVHMARVAKVKTRRRAMSSSCNKYNRRSSPDALDAPRATERKDFNGEPKFRRNSVPERLVLAPLDPKGLRDMKSITPDSRSPSSYRSLTQRESCSFDDMPTAGSVERKETSRSIPEGAEIPRESDDVVDL